MTPESQRIAIAEACGWTKCKLVVDKRGLHAIHGLERKTFLGTDPEGVHRPLPNYLSDLNAMHAAIMALNLEQLARYEQLMIDRFGFTKAITATATEQAEQFLKALNLWTE